MGVYITVNQAQMHMLHYNVNMPVILDEDLSSAQQQSAWKLDQLLAKCPMPCHSRMIQVMHAVQGLPRLCRSIAA